MIGQGVPITLEVPQDGAVLGIDSVAMTKASTKDDLAYKFIDALYDPEIQAEIAKLKKGSPAVLNAKLDPEIAKLPGVFTTAAQWKQQINIDAKLRAQKPAEWRGGRRISQPFLRAFPAPAALCAFGFLAAMAAVLQFSLRAYVPGSLE